MSNRIRLALAFALVASAPVWSAPASFLLNGTAVTVGKTLITVGDAYFYRALIRFRDGEGDPFSLEQGDALRRTAQKIAFEEMVYQELKSFQFDSAPRSQVEELIGKRKAKGKERVWRDILKYFGRTEREAVDQLYKSIQADEFLQKKVETLTPIITRREVEQYYSQNLERFKGGRLEDVSSNIEAVLKKERVRKALEEWIRFLRDKYGVTNHLAS